MIYEIRLYTVVPGRMEDNHERFRNKDHLPRLFARHGINQVGRWSATAGPNAPMYVYMMAYDDLDERERQQAAFYGDDEWWQLRAASNDGEQMVERFDLFFLKPSPAWQLNAREAGERSAGVHELIFAEIALGQNAAANRFLKEVFLPTVQEAGGDILMVADFVSGANLPRMAMIVAWKDGNAREAGRRAVDGASAVRAAQRAERQAIGRTSLGKTVVHVLEPTSFDLPLASLGFE